MTFKDRVTDIWARLNPAEPSPMYLVKLMAIMLAAFAIGLALG